MAVEKGSEVEHTAFPLSHAIVTWLRGDRPRHPHGPAPPDPARPKPRPGPTAAPATPPAFTKACSRYLLLRPFSIAPVQDCLGGAPAGSRGLWARPGRSGKPASPSSKPPVLLPRMRPRGGSYAHLQHTVVSQSLQSRAFTPFLISLSHSSHVYTSSLGKRRHGMISLHLHTI